MQAHDLKLCYTTANKFIWFEKFLIKTKKMAQLLADCLNDIFEYLEKDIVTLYSCLLVNRLWCEIAVRFLWKDTRDYKPKTFVTLIACLPSESKEILHNN